MILLVVICVWGSCYIYFISSGIWSDGYRDDIISSLATVDVFFHLFLYFISIGWIDCVESFFYDIITRVDIFCELINYSFARSTTESIIFE